MCRIGGDAKKIEVKVDCEKFEMKYKKEKPEVKQEVEMEGKVLEVVTGKTA